MIQSTVSRVICLAFIAVFAVMPMLPKDANAGFEVDFIDQTDQATDNLVVFWDMRMARQTFAQVTNVGNGTLSVHVQIFNVTSPVTVCEETDFNDQFTAGDTHVYDLGNLVSNNDADGLGGVGFSAPAADLDEGYGLLVVSAILGPRDALIGMFRIVDGDGDFEYRTNASGEEFTQAGLWNIADLNFNAVDGSNLSDVVGLVYRRVSGSSVIASPLIQAVFGNATGDVGSTNPQIHIFDEFESPTSCSPSTFACAPTLLDKGIDNFHPNSKGEVNRICNDSVDVGWLYMPLQRFNCFDQDPDAGNCQSLNLFVGFLGLNNGNGTGSMDSWWTPSLFDESPLIGVIGP